MFTKEAIKARFTELAEKRAKIKAKADPIRKERDAHVAAHQPKEAALNARLLKAEEGLYDIEQELAFLARGLGSETPALNG